jgi:sulfoxide reductase heme-binding subunit YedZ
MAVLDHINSSLRRIPAWPVYVVSVAYIAWLFWLGVTGGLGADPVKKLEHAYGEMGLYLLIAGLCITPLRRMAGLNLMKFRRATGLACFLFITVHLLTWAVLDVQRLDRVWADIVKRPYITVGMAGFVLMLPLALTSNNRAVRWLGPLWGQLHKLVYPAAILGGVHYVMLVKGWQIRPMIFLALICLLVLWRYRPGWRQLKRFVTGPVSRQP